MRTTIHGLRLAALLLGSLSLVSASAQEVDTSGLIARMKGMTLETAHVEALLGRLTLRWGGPDAGDEPVYAHASRTLTFPASMRAKSGAGFERSMQGYEVGAVIRELVMAELLSMEGRPDEGPARSHARLNQTIRLRLGRQDFEGGTPTAADLEPMASRVIGALLSYNLADLGETAMSLLYYNEGRAEGAAGPLELPPRGHDSYAACVKTFGGLSVTDRATYTLRDGTELRIGWQESDAVKTRVWSQVLGLNPPADSAELVRRWNQGRDPWLRARRREIRERLAGQRGQGGQVLGREGTVDGPGPVFPPPPTTPPPTGQGPRVIRLKTIRATGRGGVRSHLAPSWPGADNASSWPTEGWTRDDLSVRDVRLTNRDVDRILDTFAFLVVRQLQSETRADSEITMEMLLTEILERWVSETPYGSNSESTVQSAQAIVQGSNDHRSIVRRGWGICGDYQLLVPELVELATAYAGCRHLRSELGRIQVLGVYGDGRLNIPALAATHGALGLLDRTTWSRTTTRTVGGNTVRTYPANMTQDDILVFDLWVRPPLTGSVRAGEWANRNIQGQWKSIFGLARRRINLYWGDEQYWSYSF